jgi:hypothetical protein
MAGGVRNYRNESDMIRTRSVGECAEHSRAAIRRLVARDWDEKTAFIIALPTHYPPCFHTRQCTATYSDAQNKLRNRPTPARTSAHGPMDLPYG